MGTRPHDMAEHPALRPAHPLVRRDRAEIPQHGGDPDGGGRRGLYPVRLPVELDHHVDAPLERHRPRNWLPLFCSAIAGIAAGDSARPRWTRFALGGTVLGMGFYSMFHPLIGVSPVTGSSTRGSWMHLQSTDVSSAPRGRRHAPLVARPPGDRGRAGPAEPGRAAPGRSGAGRPRPQKEGGERRRGWN